MNIIKPGSRLLLGIILLLGAFSFKSDTDEQQRTEILLDLVYQGLSQNHFSYIEYDDAFSERVFNLFLDQMDYSKRFFLRTDIESFRIYEHQLDDALKNKSTQFLLAASDTFEQRLEYLEALYPQLLAEPFDFSVPDEVETDPDKRDYPNSFSELDAFWKRILKYQVLTRVYDAYKDQMENDSLEQKSLAIIEEEAREKVLKNNRDWFKRLRENDFSDHRDLYINCLTAAFDPHTSFFPPRDKENFDISMSGQFEGIGATLTVKDGYITVNAIVPGSASDRQGELEVEDKILKVAQGPEEPVDVVDMPLDEAVQLIRGKKGTEVQLTIRKADETVKVIPIIRDVVVLEETYAKSLILERENKIGYIRLPKFYADFSQSGAKSSADDMKTEIQKLMDEEVEGLIIDLRNNGGGSLQDVVKIAGYFIESGPIVQVKARNFPPLILEDTDPEVLYQGPLTILVNSYSASASEILAAALQDYNRAIVLGSKSTFGKGTVQKMIDLDRVIPFNLRHLSPLGALKMTIQKFYRINGQTTQLQGIIPDIIFPDAQTYLEVGERELDYPLPFDTIASTNYQTWDKKKIEDKIVKLEHNSQNRIEESDAFELIEKNALLLKKRQEETLLSLQFDTFSAYKEQVNDEGKTLREKLKEETGLKAYTLAADLENIESDSTKLKLHNKWKDDLKKDIQLFETLHVMDDLVEIW